MRNIGVVGAEGVGKTSFVLALGAKKSDTATATPHKHSSSKYLWPRPGGNGKATTVRIFRHQDEFDDDDDWVVVLLFDLTRSKSLAKVIAQWAHLSDSPGRRLMLVGTHADRTTDRQVLPNEVREISGGFHGYEEVCCRRASSGDEGMLRTQLLLMQWTAGDSSRSVKTVPSVRASVCGGYPSRPIATSSGSTSHSLPSSPAAQQKPRIRGDVWLYDPNEERSSNSVESTGSGGDVKMRAISKAIYDIRGAVAEKSKALAKYRDRQMSQWVTRSRYFGPTESSRHKRWQAEQKKRQQQVHGHPHHYHYVSHSRDQPRGMDPSQQRIRSVSHPDMFQYEAVRRRTRRSVSSASSSDSEGHPVTPLEKKSFMQPTELSKQRQRQLDAGAAPANQIQKKRAAQRVMRKQRRAISNDLYERSTASTAALDSYLLCYDEMDMPPQLQPVSPSLTRHSVSRPSSVSSVASSPSRRESSVADAQCRFSDTEEELSSSSAQLPLELYSPGAERVGCLPTLLPTTHLHSPISPVASPTYHPLSVESHNAVEQQVSGSTDTTATDEQVMATEAPKSPPRDDTQENTDATPSSGVANIDNNVPPWRLEDPDTSRANTVSSINSDPFDCSDIDDILDYFEGVTLPI
ncbi:hypothetical protein PHYBOEH_010260 [Phytophthora boehmeriae]|uniref:Uncharacterized protein n=1 Tax=Phytophthora boehmeriae TaxID=109152 RepID=A0A8T1X6Q0_9STRA|nr:hypothetical protein PHYBOEH_010260 [Phytophthora boehmeriae]